MTRVPIVFQGQHTPATVNTIHCVILATPLPLTDKVKTMRERLKEAREQITELQAQQDNCLRTPTSSIFTLSSRSLCSPTTSASSPTATGPGQQIRQERSASC